MTIKFIAEIGSNHNCDIVRTLKLIDEAKNIGAWGVKFQLFKAHKLYAPEFKTQIKKMKKWELPINFINHIKTQCQINNLKFICTPFDLAAVNFLKDRIDIFKIGSYELLYIDLIKAVIKTEQPWIMSTGMTMFSQIAEIVEKELNNPPCALLACNSNYPAKPENCNLGTISKLKNYFFRCLIGWSDHTVEPGIIYKAIALGAKMIEFHFDLEDGKGFESKIGHCWKPSQIKDVIRNIKIGEMAEQTNNTRENEARKWRTDPKDGLRPLKEFREELLKCNTQ